MDINRIKKPLGRFLKNIPETIKVDQVIIFGSRLEGNATEDSDIDIYVVSNNFKKLDEDKRLDILYKAGQFIEPDIHPWGVTNEELKKASHLTLMGYARDNGIRFL